jgi:hypothetical protein
VDHARPDRARLDRRGGHRLGDALGLVDLEARSEIRDAARLPSAAPTLLLSLLLVRRAELGVVPGRRALVLIGGGVSACSAGLCLGGVEFVKHGDPGASSAASSWGRFSAGLRRPPASRTPAYAVLAGSGSASARAAAARPIRRLGRVARDPGRGARPAAAAARPPWRWPPAAAAVRGPALARRRGRARWLSGAAAGRDEMFRIDPRRGAEEEACLLPVLRPGLTPLDHVVLRRAAAGDPYRSASGWVPVALTATPDLAPERGASHGGIAAAALAAGKTAVVLLVVGFCMLVMGSAFLGWTDLIVPIQGLG